MVYIYESHLGGLYVETEKRSLDELYCDECGDYDNLVFESNDIYEIAEFLKSEYKYTTEIFKICEELLKNDSLEKE